MNIIKQSYKILTPIEREDIYALIELSGRTAYKSEAKIDVGSAEQFISKLIASGHESVIEHFNLTIKFVTDRGVTHELVRHRLVSYTQESTRYCDYSKKGVTFIEPPWGFDETDLGFLSVCELQYNEKIRLGQSPQQARAFLPNCLKTEIVCTTNIREWRHILRLRTSKRAHPQIRDLMLPLLDELQTKLPALFEDIVGGT